MKTKTNTTLRESGEIYKIPQIEENEIYNENKIKEIHKKHDKMFRNILSRKKEIVEFLNDFLELREKIKEDHIIQCHTDFITRKYQEKHSDIVYKLKEKPVYFLIEHQSTIDRNMPLRLWEYVGEVMRKESIVQKTYERKEKIYPVVVPIIIYTGYQNWKRKTNFAQSQYHSNNYEKYEVSLEYNLITVQDYTFEKLLQKKTLFSSIMIMEKCKEIDELILQIDKIIDSMEEPKNLEMLAGIIENIIVFRIGKEKASELLEKIKMKGEIGMSPLTKMLLDLEYKNWKQGQKQGILKTIDKMLECEQKDEKIIITKKELEKIKKELIGS